MLEERGSVVTTILSSNVTIHDFSYRGGRVAKRVAAIHGGGDVAGFEEGTELLEACRVLCGGEHAERVADEW